MLECGALTSNFVIKNLDSETIGLILFACELVMSYFIQKTLMF